MPGIEVFLDVCPREFEAIYPAAGANNTAVKMTPDELLEVTGRVGWISAAARSRESVGDPWAAGGA